MYTYILGMRDPRICPQNERGHRYQPTFTRVLPTNDIDNAEDNDKGSTNNSGSTDNVSTDNGSTNNNVSTDNVSTDNKIVQIALGGEHTCILYENNWIFSMGDNQVYLSKRVNIFMCLYMYLFMYLYMYEYMVL
jgi:alpha-tubulin suppressor-like RCC1 family protein